MKKVFGKNKGNKIGAPVGSAEYGKFKERLIWIQ